MPMAQVITVMNEKGGIENPNKEKITIATLINMVIQEEKLPPMVECNDVYRPDCNTNTSRIIIGTRIKRIAKAL